MCHSILQDVKQFRTHVQHCNLKSTLSTEASDVSRNTHGNSKPYYYSTDLSSESSSDGYISESSESSSNDDLVQMVLDQQGNKVLGESAWNKVAHKKVSETPIDINGECVFTLKGATRAELLQKCRNGQPWHRDTITKWSGYVSVRYKDCGGTLRCSNPSCTYVQQFGSANRLKFDNTKICLLCGALGIDMVCPARKYTTFVSEKRVRIFHYGIHTCKSKQSTQRPTELISAAMNLNPKTKPSAIQGKAVLSAIRNRKSWGEVTKIAKKLTDKRATLSVLIFACIYFRELKKIVFREYLFSRMTSF